MACPSCAGSPGAVEMISAAPRFGFMRALQLSRDRENMTRGRIAALNRKALRGQWSLDAAIDWRQGVTRPWWLPRKTYVAMVSQLYHAELATQKMCRRLHAELPESEAKRFLRGQSTDEARHAEAYRIYLERLGDIAPINEAVEAALEGGFAWAGSVYGPLVAFNVVLEGEALRLQRELSEMFPCPLLGQINERIARDEARHVAFGKIYLRDKLALLPFDERLAIYLWVKRLWHVCTSVNAGRRGPAASTLIRLGRRRLGERWLEQHQTLIDVGLLTRPEAARAVAAMAP